MCVCVCVCVWSRNLNNEATVVRFGLCRQKKNRGVEVQLRRSLTSTLQGGLVGSTASLDALSSCLVTTNEQIQNLHIQPVAK